jgi:hypothetical protein
LTHNQLHYALHAVHPHFKDGVFTSNQQAMEVLERQDKALASKVYALAKRQSNGTVTTAPPPVNSPNTPTTPAGKPSLTPIVTSSTSSYETVITTNGQRSTLTTFTVVVKTATPTGGGNAQSPNDSTSTVNPSLQSFAIRSTSFTIVMVLLPTHFIAGILWMLL